MNYEHVIRAAVEVRQRAYAPYSNFLVGAAIQTIEGDVFTGANVENASYGLTICAERTAVFTAVAAGRRQFEILAIATAGGATPCGACRQVLFEFAPDLPILLIDVNQPDAIKQTNLRELLPAAFTVQSSKFKVQS
jgi:cytidine deaminase